MPRLINHFAISILSWIQVLSEYSMKSELNNMWINMFAKSYVLLSIQLHFILAFELMQRSKFYKTAYLLTCSILYKQLLQFVQSHYFILLSFLLFYHKGKWIVSRLKGECQIVLYYKFTKYDRPTFVFDALPLEVHVTQ